MDNDSLYFATVRRATCIPSSASIFASLLSLSVSLGFLLRLVSSLKPELLLKRLHLRYQYLRGLRKNTSIRNSPRTMQIFLRCNARNGGLVHLNLFCNIGQNKGFHMLFTEFEKRLLCVNNAMSDF
ncbi:Uncharacterised protein [Proteus mirabilis]|uniref:Uncharacterized protein n=1 Tax=Proteus mirabilis TaxID=584 RepID=A0A379FJI9_PROMI|nr:Uncharacterised protein [Proteus mirabilis]